MIVTAVTALASLGFAAWNQHKNNEATKKQQQLNKQMEADNEQDKIRNSYRNSLESPTAKGQLMNIRRNAEFSNNSRDNENVAGQRTHQQSLASKNATNATVANATNNIVANQERAQAVKDEQYMNRAKELNYRDQAYKGAEARSRDALTQNIIGSIGDVAATFADGAIGNATKENRPMVEAETEARSNIVNSDINGMAKNNVKNLVANPTTPNLADLNNDAGIASVINRANENATASAIKNANHNYISDELADIDTTGKKPKATNNGSFNWFTNAFKNGEMDKSDYNSYIKKRRGLMLGKRLQNTNNTRQY